MIPFEHLGRRVRRRDRQPSIIAAIAQEMAPITFSFGFLEAPLGIVADETRAWAQRIGFPRRSTPVVAPFPESLRHLEPLGAPACNQLWVATRSPRWQTAYFDGFINGGDPFAPISYLATQLGCHGLIVTCCPDTDSSYGANKLEIYGPNPTDWLNLIWSVSALNDGGKWVWHRSGPTYAFEETGSYGNHRIKKRFTPEMLLRYCAALEVPLTPDQYLEMALLESPQRSPDAQRTETLRQARIRFGLA